jgi:hypothetical protein
MTTVMYAYRHDGLTLLKGPWLRHLSVYARRSLEWCEHNWMPRALASAIDSTCGLCGKKYMGAMSFWGMVVHAQCLRPLLLNTYYLRDRFGVEPRHIEHVLPQESLRGYASHERGEYGYRVVFLHPYRGLVPSKWTLKTFLESERGMTLTSAFREKKRKAREAEEMRQHAKRQRQERRDVAMEERRRHLQETDPAAYALALSFPCVVGDYLTSRRLTPSTKLRMVIENAHRLGPMLTVLRPSDVISPDMGVNETVRRHVSECLGSLISTVVRTYGKCRCGSPAARKCVFKKCGKCCEGCPRHTLMM